MLMAQWHFVGRARGPGGRILWLLIALPGADANMLALCCPVLCNLCSWLRSHAWADAGVSYGSTRAVHNDPNVKAYMVADALGNLRPCTKPDPVTYT